MGIKRKASALEEPPICVHQPSSPPSLISTSPHSSPSSMCTESYHIPTPIALDDYSQTTIADAAPWLNMRTRKRVRDNRPSEEVIHYETLRKLFEGQRHTHSEGEMMLVLPEKEADLAMDMDLDMDVDMFEPSIANVDEAMELSIVPEPKQRSLHDFFGRNRAPSLKSTRQVSNNVEMSEETIQHRPVPVSQGAVLPCDFAPAYRPQQQWRAEGMLFRSESEL